MASSFGSRFYSSFNRFREANPDEARAKVKNDMEFLIILKPVIRTSGDYVTEDGKKRLEEKVNFKEICIK